MAASTPSSKNGCLSAKRKGVDRFFLSSTFSSLFLVLLPFQSFSHSLLLVISHTIYLAFDFCNKLRSLSFPLSLSSVADTCVLSIVQGLSASTKKQEADVAAAAAAAAQAEANSSSSRRADKPRHIRRDKEGERVFAAE